MTFRKGNKHGRNWKKKRLPSISSLETKLDDIFSVYVRRRHADEGGTVECVTCGKLMHWTKDGAQAGHYVKRQHRSTRWRETNVHVQCVSCNKWRGGMQDEYADFIMKTYGAAELADIMACKHQVKKYTRADLEEMIATYYAKVAELPA